MSYRLIYIKLIILSIVWGSFNHPELEWNSLHSKHFIVHYHDGTKRTAIETMEVAEQIYESITQMYGYEPDSKTQIIIRDTDDFSNGAAYFFDNKMEIWASPLDFDLRGSHRWLQNVITHEFAHIVQLGASLKYGRKIPGFYFQALMYEEEKRKDVIHGYPSTIISYPIPTVSIPPWLAEGTAQYMIHDIDYDYWDTHRDMILRDAVINKHLWNFNEMNSFGKAGIGNELVYNQGFSLVSFIAEKYGENTLRELSEELSKPFQYSANSAIKNVIGISGYELYALWVEKLENKYWDVLEQEDPLKNKVILSEGTSNFHATWSPDGNKIAFLSNKNKDYFSQTGLYIYDFSDSSSYKLVDKVVSQPTWINDTTIVYSKKSKPNKYGSKFFDLFSINISDDKSETQLTYGSRLNSPIYNMETNQIAAIALYDGTSNIYIAEFDSVLTFNKVTDFENGIKIYSMDWNNGSLVFDANDFHGRNIFQLDLDSGIHQPVIYEPWDTRDPVIYNNEIYYSSDKNGVFNLALNGNIITDALGGLFMPDISIDGKVAFSMYDNGQYKIAISDSLNLITSNKLNQPSKELVVGEIDLVYSDTVESLDSLHMTIEDSELLFYKAYIKENYDNFNDSFSNYKVKLDKENSQKVNQNQDDSYSRYSEKIAVDMKAYNKYNKISEYNQKLSSPTIIPRIMLDYETVKSGLYFYAMDPLERYLLFGGWSINNIMDQDIFLLFELNKYFFSYYSNLYWISRHLERSDFMPSVTGEDYQNIRFKSDDTYMLFSVDLGLRTNYKGHQIWLQYNYSKYRAHTIGYVRKYHNDILMESYPFDLSYDYYRGHKIGFMYKLENTAPVYSGNMLPRNGFKIEFDSFYEDNSFDPAFEVSDEYGTLDLNFTKHNTQRTNLIITKFWSLYNFSISNKIQYNVLSNNEVDDFFYFFGGGMTGIKGYTFYDESLSGTKLKIFSSYIRYPLLFKNDNRILQFSVQNLSLGYVFQVGNADDNDFMSSNGIEIRVNGSSFYGFPFAVSYEFHIPNVGEKVGRHYVKLLFDFQN